MHTVVQIFAAVCFGVLAVGTPVLGANRGNKIKRLNATVIHFFVGFMTLWYCLAVWGDLALKQIERDDGFFDIPLLHYISSTTIMVTFTALVSYKIKQNTLNVISYTVVCFFVNTAMVLSVTLANEGDRNMWLIVGIVFTIFLLINTVKDSNEDNVGNHKFVRMVIILVTLYITTYLVVTLMGPLHQDLVSFSAQEVVLTAADLLVSVLCGISVIHYGWAVGHKVVSSSSPGFVWHLAAEALRSEHPHDRRVRLHPNNYLSSFISEKLEGFVDERIHTYS